MLLIHIKKCLTWVLQNVDWSTGSRVVRSLHSSRTFLHESWHWSHCLNHLPPKCESVSGALKDDLQDTNQQDSYIICGGTVQKPPGYSLRISSPLVRALHQEQSPAGGRSLWVFVDTGSWGQVWLQKMQSNAVDSGQGCLLSFWLGIGMGHVLWAWLVSILRSTLCGNLNSSCQGFAHSYAQVEEPSARGR